MEEERMTARTFQALQVVFATGIILQNMDAVKGTVLFSSKVIQALEHYDRTKLKDFIWNKSKKSPDESYHGSQTISKMAYAYVHVAHNQPDHVQDRFERDLEALFIRYGVNMTEMEKL